MSHTEQLIARIEALAEREGRAPSTVAARLLGSGSIFENLKSGKTITLSKYEKVCAQLDELERAA